MQFLIDNPLVAPLVLLFVLTIVIINVKDERHLIALGFEDALSSIQYVCDLHEIPQQQYVPILKQARAFNEFELTIDELTKAGDELERLLESTEHQYVVPKGEGNVDQNSVI